MKPIKNPLTKITLLILTALLTACADNHPDPAVIAAYNKGQSDSIKELYWAKQRDKGSLAPNQQQTKTVAYPINIPAGTVNGINYEQQTVILPVATEK